MTLGFGLCGSLASLSYRIFARGLGWSHNAAKATHGSLHAAALTLGTVGVMSMWKTHANAAHFQSLHSWIGIAALSLYWIHFLSSLYIFTQADGETRKAFLPFHRFAGATLTLLCLGTLITGTLSLVARGKPDGTFTTAQATMNVGTLCVVVQCVLFAWAPRESKDQYREGGLCPGATDE